MLDHRDWVFDTVGFDEILYAPLGKAEVMVG